MRITGGKARGISLSSPKGSHTRPATDQLREAAFSSLGTRVEGARVADFFAGTGAYGLEAMSRGAASGLFVESHREAVACLRKNLSATIKSCGLTHTADWKVVAQKIETLASPIGSFDLVFIDPPYDQIEDQLPQLFTNQIAPTVAQGGRVCFEMPGNLDLELTGWSVIKRLGKSGRDKPTLVFYERT